MQKTTSEYHKLLIKNKSWAKENIKKDKNLFRNQSKEHTPKFLWITCCDSRVSPITITKTLPGEILEYRSMANIISNKDLNFIAILKYAISYLNIRNIVICGHYECGGIISILTDDHIPIIHDHLSQIKDIAEKHKDQLNRFKNIKDKANLLAELNLKVQVDNLMLLDIIKSYTKKSQLNIYGCMYNLYTGLIKESYKLKLDTN